MSNGCTNKSKPKTCCERKKICVFIGSWLLLLVLVYWYTPSSWVYYISKIVLLIFPTIKGNLYLSEKQVGALLCVIILCIFSFFMYLLNRPLGGLLKQIDDRGYICKSNEEWSDYLSSKIPVYTVFAGAMGTMLVFLLGFLMTKQTVNSDTLICYIGSVLLVIGIILTLSCIEIIGTTSGKKWTNDERKLFYGRAVNYYILSWYCLISSILILVSVADPFITFIGTLVYWVIIPRYFFFSNLPPWKW